jgi:hypothetical protein
MKSISQVQVSSSDSGTFPVPSPIMLPLPHLGRHITRVGYCLLIQWIYDPKELSILLDNLRTQNLNSTVCFLMLVHTQKPGLLKTKQNKQTKQPVPSLWLTGAREVPAGIVSVLTTALRARLSYCFHFRNEKQAKKHCLAAKEYCQILNRSFLRPKTIILTTKR